ncbi:hypothetical protein O4J56_17780, partial [Nocardiopsis sp. RSe5-2]
MNRNPHITARLAADGTGVLTVDGAEQPVSADDISQARTRVIGLVAEHAAALGRALPLSAHEPDGRTFSLLIHSDGSVEEALTEDTPPPAQAAAEESGQALGPAAAPADLKQGALQEPAQDTAAADGPTVDA